MKYAPLIWAALWRKPWETLLTALSISAAFTLFGLMVGLDATTRQLVQSSRLDRLWVNARFFSPSTTGLPIGLTEQISRMHGVSGVGATLGFGGFRVDRRNPVFVMLMNEGMRLAWSEGSLSPAQWDQLFSTPAGLFVSRRAAAKWQLKPGDRFTFSTEPGRRADGGASWDFKVLGVIDDDRDFSGSEGLLIGNYKFVDNALPLSAQGTGLLLHVAVRDASRALEISRGIDQHFANSDTPTISIPKRVSAQADIDRGVDMATMTWSIAGAGMVMVLFLTANAIARSVRERVPEFAVLESLGFRNAHLMALVLIEVAVPCCLGALIGTGLAAMLAKTSRHFVSPTLAAQLVESPTRWVYVLTVSLGVAALLALASSAVPLSRLRRISVTDALAGR